MVLISLLTQVSEALSNQSLEDHLPNGASVLQVVIRQMQPSASQPTRVSNRETRAPQRFSHGSQPEGRRRRSPPPPPPSPPREERPLAVVPQPGVERAAPGVRLEIIGVGEEEEILELVRRRASPSREERPAPAPVQAPAPAPRIDRLQDIVGLAEERVSLEDWLDPDVPGPHPGPVGEDATGWSRIDSDERWAEEKA